jgi:hypothetical protein
MHEGRSASRKVCGLFDSGETQAFLMPDAWNSFEGVNLIAAVEELDVLDLGNLPRVFDLLGFQFVMILTGLEKVLQERAVRDANLGPNFKLGFVQPLRFSQGAIPAFFPIRFLRL